VKVRLPAVAGRFYPADPGALRQQVQRLLTDAPSPRGRRPKGLIVPHAGYIYSGPIAATGYAWLFPCAETIDRVILLGTCHSPGIKGLAASSADAFLTPLGKVPVDRPSVYDALRYPQVQLNDDASDRDHAIEVQLPFLQVVLESFSIVPFLVGQADKDAVADVLDALWDGDRTIIVVSSDLTHHLPLEEARLRDRVTANAIERLDGAALGPRSACGRSAIAGLLTAAQRHGLSSRTVDLRTSGDTAGPRQSVVGYGSWVFSREDTAIPQDA
jgi:AmmeMemoRadiSam system protein B